MPRPAACLAGACAGSWAKSPGRPVHATGVRIAQRDEIAGAAEQVKAWGYPRELEPEDLDGLWVAVEAGERVVAWYWLVWVRPGDAALHICADPAHRSHSAARHVLRSFAWVGELMGARRVWAESKPLPGWEPAVDGHFFLEVRHG